MCGIVALISNEPANQPIYDALSVIQHRGQDAAGIMTFDESGRFYRHKGNGLVRDVFTQEQFVRLRGNMGIGHVRYPTAGSSSLDEAQPFYLNTPYGIAFAHNGNLTNAASLKKYLYEEELRHINTNSDSEILHNVFSRELRRQGGVELTPEKIFAAVSGVHKRCRGSYAVVAMTPGQGILGFRDPYGIRPLVYGSRHTENGTEYMLASESVALHALGFDVIRDVAPGEAIFINKSGQVFSQQCADNVLHTPCLFEFVYFARPDSTIDGISVYNARVKMGEFLGQQILERWPDHGIDVVIPIPESSRPAALECAQTLKTPYREGFVKNRYIGRTFIMGHQETRKKSVRQKLNTIDSEFAGKTVLLVDDSIVRGTTAREIVQMARDSGAKQVYFASAAPPVCHPNVYGIDMAARKELIAHGRSIDDIADYLGVDKLVYQSLDKLLESVQGSNPNITQFDASCFDGNYVTGDVDEAYLENVEALRSDLAKETLEKQRALLA